MPNSTADHQDTTGFHPTRQSDFPTSGPSGTSYSVVNWGNNASETNGPVSPSDRERQEVGLYDALEP